MAGSPRFQTSHMAYIALMVVLISLCSWISLPSIVPFTMQTFGIFCALGLLGGRRGFMALLVYILMGAAGLPVFSGFTGGIGRLLGPTGGYILGFLVMALLYWLLEGAVRHRPLLTAAALLLGLTACYAFGTAWFMIVYSRSAGAVGLLGALSMCVFPFIIPDMIKLGLAMLVLRILKKHIKVK